VFRRRSTQPPVEPAADRPHERCTAAGCRRRDGIRCSYVDKRARACPTAWCPEHVVEVSGIAYCRRHASTMIAIEGSEVIAGLPDLDNRAPSLAGWVGRELDAPIRELFARIAPVSAARLVADPVRLLMTPGGTTRRWAMTWKMIHRNEIVSRVSIEVDEADDCQVAALVDNELIGQGIPPWIEHRLAGHRVDAAVDAAERQQFATAMARSIELVVTGQEVPQGS
jgi:hypothetical protein